MGFEVLEDLEDNRETLDVQAAAARVQAPWLLVHGRDDESVPAQEGRDLLQAAGGPDPDHRELVEIPGAGHTFGATHPFASPTPPPRPGPERHAELVPEAPGVMAMAR